MVGAKGSAWIPGLEAGGRLDRKSVSGRVWSVCEEELEGLARSTDVEGLILVTGLVAVWVGLLAAWTSLSEMEIGLVVV